MRPEVGFIPAAGVVPAPRSRRGFSGEGGERTGADPWVVSLENAESWGQLSIPSDFSPA